MKLLVSVVDADEARAAAAAGADIVDVKNPAEGSLGAPSPAVIAAVARGRARRAAGQRRDRRHAQSARHGGARRPGRGAQRRDVREGRAVGRLDRGRGGRAAARGPRRRVPGAIVVAAAYADARRVPHAPLAPELLPRVARAAGVGVCLLDTAVKDGRGLLDWLVARRARRRWWPRRTPRACRWRWPAPCAPRTCRWCAPPAPTSPASARPPAATARARDRSTRRASAPCAAAPATPLRAASMSPATWSRWATLRALCSRVAAGTASPQTVGGLLGPLQQVVEDLRGGLGLDQAAQAEADVPALVALDALDPLAHAGQGAVGQVVEQRVLPGVEDDPLEQHVVEADALARARCGPPRARRPSPAAAPRRARAARAGRGPGPRRAARPASAPGSPSTSSPMRSKSSAWRCSSRRWRKKTQAIRLSWEASVAARAASANGVRCSATASSATQKPASSVSQPVAALGRELGPRAGVRGEVDGPGFHCRRATIREKKFGQKLRFASTKSSPPRRCVPELRVGQDRDA